MSKKRTTNAANSREQRHKKQSGSAVENSANCPNFNEANTDDNGSVLQTDSLPDSSVPMSVRAFEIVSENADRFTQELMAEIMAADEPLLPELRRVCHEQRIRHPLIVTSAVNPAFANFEYLRRKKAADKALAGQEWEKYVFAHERPWRIDIFASIVEELDDASYWELLSIVYVDSDSITLHGYSIGVLLTASRPRREAIMTKSEIDSLAQLPRSIEVYRGFKYSYSEGWSWTTSKDKAVFFANQFGEICDMSPRVAIGSVSKSDVIAYFDRRGESEVICNLGSVNVSSIERIDGTADPVRIVQKDKVTGSVESPFTAYLIERNPLLKLGELRAVLAQIPKRLQDIISVHGHDAKPADLNVDFLCCPILRAEVQYDAELICDLFDYSEEARCDIKSLIAEHGDETICGNFELIVDL